jgi:hypothetical protein
MTTETRKRTKEERHFKKALFNEPIGKNAEPAIPVTGRRRKREVSEQLARDVQAYLQGGKKIEQVPSEHVESKWRPAFNQLREESGYEIH